MTSLTTMAALACAATGMCGADVEDFDTYHVVGNFPAPYWQDIGLLNPDAPNPPDPSAVVVETTDAFGQPTNALQIVEAVAPSQGIYHGLAAGGEHFVVSADVRIDQYSDGAQGADWAMQVGINGFAPGIDPCCIDTSIGIYASGATQTWHIYAATVPNAPFSINADLGVPAEVGVWYTLRLEVTIPTGEIRSRIWNTATGELLIDDVQFFPNPDTVHEFTIVSFFDGELSEDATFGNVAVADNIEFSVDQTCPGDCNADGELNILDFVCFQELFLAGCP